MRIAIIWIFLLGLFTLKAQVSQPVTYTTEVKHISGNDYELRVNFKIEPKWHLFSTQHRPNEENFGTGIPLSFEWEKSNNVQIIGGLKEIGKLISKRNEEEDQTDKYYENKVTVIQKIRLKEPKPETIVAFMEGQACTTVCIRIAPEISFKLVPVKSAEKTTTTTEEKDEPKEDKKEDVEKIDTAKSITITDESSLPSVPDISEEEPEACPVVSEKRFTGESTADGSSDSWWGLFIKGFIGGFLALLMPCVFPMIPLTVSVFTKQSKSSSEGIRNAVIFGISIIVIYVAIGMIFAYATGASGLNQLSTNPWLNVIFFLLFVVLALSFFGAYEINLPSKWVNSADKKANQGGLIGIFFMAFTLALVSFSCTGPIIGFLLVDATTAGNWLGLGVAMFAFSLALAIPFMLFAMFPGWMNSLPKSGGWLNAVKVSLGFIELAFAMKFLSKADLVWQLGWITREVFLAIWIAIFLLWGLYLLKVYVLNTDSPNDHHISWPRLSFAILAFSILAYLAPGLSNDAPLKLMSGLLPPAHYSEKGFGENLEGHRYAGPHGIPVFKDFAYAAEYSRQTNKPILIDFTGHGCENCRKVEDNVWADPSVKKILTNDVIVASLYGDERTKLPENERVYNKFLDRRMRDIGDKWTAFQIEHFNSNAQPLYQLVDCELNRYSTKKEAEYDVENYKKWLLDGIENYNKYNK